MRRDQTPDAARENVKVLPAREAERKEMVRRQIAARGVRSEAVLEAMEVVPRHEFVPEGMERAAYDDTPLPIGHGQTISQPYMVALMTEALGAARGDRILEIGTGSGYQAAVLAQMGCDVDTVERNELLAGEARARLSRLGWPGVRVHVGDGTKGWVEAAPYRAILVTAGAPRVPESLKAQLDPDGGVLVIPVGEMGYQDLVRIVRKGSRFEQQNLGGCRFVPLTGEEGW
jgi:protein-L-isoaspartate(D-aspartate) O-methyltransferase